MQPDVDWLDAALLPLDHDQRKRCLSSFGEMIVLLPSGAEWPDLAATAAAASCGALMAGDDATSWFWGHAWQHFRDRHDLLTLSHPNYLDR